MTQNQLNKYLAQKYGLSAKYIESLNGKVERRIALLLKQNLKEVKSKLADMYEQYGDNVRLADMNKYNRLKNIENDIKTQLTKLGNNGKYMIDSHLVDVFKEKYYYCGYAVETGLSTGMGFTGLNTNYIRSAIINPYDAIKWPKRLQGHITKLNQGIQQSLTKALIQGDGYSQTAREFSKTFDITFNQAKRIIWTESKRVESVANTAAFEKTQSAADRLGIKLERLWDAVNESDPKRKHKPPHQYLDGKPADENGEWRFSDGTITKGPAQSGVAKHDIHCRCDVRTEVKKMSKAMEKKIAEMNIPDIEYNDWKQNKDIPIRKAA